MNKNLLLISGLALSGVALSQPSVSAISSSVGPIGTNLVISGTGFNTSAAQNVVYFGATKATVNNAAATSLSVTVPVGANHKAISVLNAATGLSGYSSSIFNTSFSCGSSLSAASFASSFNYAVGGSSERTANIGDLDGDGKSEMVIANQGGGYVSVFRNTSTPGILNGTSFAPKSI